MTIATFSVTGNVVRVKAENIEADGFYYVTLAINKSYKPKNEDKYIDKTEYVLMKVFGKKVTKVFTKGYLVQCTGNIWFNTKEVVDTETGEVSYDNQTGFDVRDFSLLGTPRSKQAEAA